MPLDVYDSRQHPPDPPPARPAEPRPYICIYFECCGVYDRVYRPPDRPQYHGRCPKCLREVHVRVGPEGTDARFFRAS